MRIKKHSTKNEYLLTNTGLWVRNFAKRTVPYIDINGLSSEDVLPKFLENEISNGKIRYPWIDTERFIHPNILIVSDGYHFPEYHKVIASLSTNDVAVMAVNRSLVKWRVTERSPTYYVVNNPYNECMNWLPKKMFPRCIASTRTNHEFLNQYKGIRYRYTPVSDRLYTGPVTNEVDYQIDDYRNPICAAIGLAYHFGVEKLVLLCCDDSFKDERPGAEQLPNGLWQYPTQRIPHSLIDANLYWLKQANQEMKIRHCSASLDYANATYINSEAIKAFFEDSEEV